MLHFVKEIIMLGKNLLTSRQAKLETRRQRCDICQSICAQYVEEPYGNGKLVRLKCPRCNWISEGKVFLKEYNIPLQNRQRVAGIPEEYAIEKKENREERLQHYSPFLSETPMKANSSNPKTMKETRRNRRKLLKQKSLVHTTGKVEVLNFT